MPVLTEWLQLMLAEIARKRDDLELARAEEAKRATELHPTASPPAPEVRAARG